MKVIAISGKAGSGKTTLAENLRKNLPEAQIRKFARPLYDTQRFLQRTLMLEESKQREILIAIGESSKKVYGESVFTNALKNSLERDQDMLDYVIIDDMRFDHEIGMLYNSGFDVLTVRLHAPEHVLDRRVGVPANRDHISETDLDNAMFDLYIDVNVKNEEEVLDEIIRNL